jgi:putative membrane-bound dehydrogenase-like protein
MRRLLLALVVAAAESQAPAQTVLKPAVPASTAPLSPAAEAATFHLPPGYHLELVASEPMVIEPVLCTWDADGRMFVAEMRTYVQDADGTGTDQPRSRVVRLEDTDGDGRMDRAVTFADKLLLPRMVLPLDDRVLVMETYDGVLWSYRDADGDGVAESREKVFEYGRSGANLEHQDSALTWGIDNWLYTAMGQVRLHFGAGAMLQSEPVYGEFSQWGLGVDDLGRQYFATAGGERPAYGFLQHRVYGALELEGTLAPGFEEPFPLVALPDVQGGPGRLKPDGTLNHFTACCGQSIYRGDALPDDLRGNYILCEPVGRLVRRAVIDVAQGVRVLRNAHPGSEFLRSTDPNFRPIWSATGPDGCLYFVDMYRGIIQESNWVRKDSYLRPVVEKLGLDKNIGRGRIWRLVHDGRPPQPAPKLLHADEATLLTALASRNGWTRDTAQRQLVLRHAASAIPALRAMVTSCPEPLGRVHALWTLDGLAATTAATLSQAFGDADGRVRVAAARVAETLLRQGDETLMPQLRKLSIDPELDVRVQVLQSIRYLPAESGHDLAIAILAAHGKNKFVQAVGRTTLAHGSTEKLEGLAHLSADDLQRWQHGRTIFRSLCISCHGADGMGQPSGDLRLAPPLRGSRWLLYDDQVALRIVLFGLTGPIDGTEFPGNLMAPQQGNDDVWVADVVTYARNAFGNLGPPVTAVQVAAVRKQYAGRNQPWTTAELTPMLPLGREQMAKWKLSASHAAGECRLAVDGDPGSRWTTGTSMRPGMWFQIDFGGARTVRSLLLDCAGSAGDYPRGFKLLVGGDGEHWQVVAEGTGQQAVLHIAVGKPVAGRFLRIEQTGSDGLWWSIHELSVVGD